MFVNVLLFAKIIIIPVPTVGINAYKLGNGVSLEKKNIEYKIDNNPIRLRVSDVFFEKLYL